MIDAIENQLITTMKAWSDLDGVAVFCRGFVLYPPRDWYPLVEVFTSRERLTSRGTGGYAYNEYVGFLQASVRVPDRPTVTDRVATVSSYTEVRTYIRAMRAALTQSDLGGALGGLARADGNEAVTQFELGDESDIEYGIESRDRRRDSLNNYGVLPFRVETREARGG